MAAPEARNIANRAQETGRGSPKPGRPGGRGGMVAGPSARAAPLVRVQVDTGSVDFHPFASCRLPLPSPMAKRSKPTPEPRGPKVAVLGLGQMGLVCAGVLSDKGAVGAR